MPRVMTAQRWVAVVAVVVVVVMVIHFYLGAVPWGS
jgi:hypothetical protein